EICHIVGVTPEAPTLEVALNHLPARSTRTITDVDLDRAAGEIGRTGRGEVEYVSLGCPHYSLKQIQYVARWLEGRKVARGVTLDVWTAPATRHNAVLSEFVEQIEAAGGRVLTSTCPLVSQAFPRVSSMAFDSMKQARYMMSSTDARIYAGDVDDCLTAATTGV